MLILVFERQSRRPDCKEVDPGDGRFVSVNLLVGENMRTSYLRLGTEIEALQVFRPTEAPPFMYKHASLDCMLS